MALIKFGAIITDSRGSIGGHKFQWTRAGHTLGARAATAKRRTEKQTQVRATFALLTKRWWSTLDATQRGDWRDLAAANPLPNRWGDTYPLTGLAFYVRVNQRLIQATGTATDDAPEDQTVTALTSMTCTAAAPSTASLSFLPATVPSECALVVFASEQLSPGISTAQRRCQWLMAIPAGETSPQAIGSELTTLTGPLGSGRAVWLQGAFLNVTNGARSPLITTQAIVA